MTLPNEHESNPNVVLLYELLHKVEEVILIEQIFPFLGQEVEPKTN